MADGAPTNWLDVVKASFWPILAVIFIAIFASPLSALLTAMSAGVGPAQEVDIGSLKFKFSEKAAAALAPPSADVAAALTKLQAGQIDMLLAQAETLPSVICLRAGWVASSGVETRTKAEIYEAFEALGLIRYVPDENSGDYCAADNLRFAYLTPLGMKTRKYLIDVLTKTITISKS